MHDGRNSRLFHEKITSTLGQDAAYAVRTIVGKIGRSVQGVVSAILHRHPPQPRSRSPYLLLIAPGNGKYASEERAIIEACRAKGVALKAVHTGATADTSFDVPLLSMASTLTPWDHFRVLLIWSWQLIRGVQWYCTRDRMQRNLLVASIPCIWEYDLNVAFARRIAAEHGDPRLLLGLLPASPVVVAIVDYMKGRGVLTAGIRTQTTSRSTENLAINADILFWKSPHERRAYEEIFAGTGPRLERGCLLSLPEAGSAEPLRLPEKYVLLLGTAPTADQDDLEYGRYNEKLFQMAAAADMPVVFKGHNLAKELDDAWLAGRSLKAGSFWRIQGFDCNRELIDAACLVVSAPSTLLYYAILSGKPVIVVESKIVSAIPDEFGTAPIQRIPWEQPFAVDRLDWDALRSSSLAAKAWFEENYSLNKGADYLVDFLLKEADCRPGTSLPTATG
jgi:hypothetical protein